MLGGHVPGLGNNDDDEEERETIYIGIRMLLGTKGKRRHLEMEDTMSMWLMSLFSKFVLLLVKFVSS